MADVIVAEDPWAAPKMQVAEGDPWEGKSGGFDVSATAKRAGINALGVTDFLLSLPGMALGVGADIGARAVGAAVNEPRRETSAGGVRIGSQVTEALTGPLHKLMKALGHGEDYEAGDVQQALTKFSSWLEQGAEYVEKQTKGTLLKEDVQTLTNVVMVGLGARGGDFALNKMQQLAKEQAERAAAGPAQAPKTEPAVAPAATAEPSRVPGFDHVQANAELKAYDLLRRGASKKEVESVRKRDPLVGQVLNEMMSRRYATREGFGETLQGEVLPPEGPQGRLGQAGETVEGGGLPATARELPGGPKLLRAPEPAPDAAPFQGAERREAPRTMPNEAKLRSDLEKVTAARDALPEGTPEAKALDQRASYIANQLREVEIAGKAADDLLYKQQGGRVRPEIAARLGLAVGGAAAGALLTDDPWAGAVAGAGLGLVPGGAGWRGASRQAGAVKAPGGMWHPETVERLRDPLYANMSVSLPMDSLGAIATKDWSTKRIRDYLNKHAGTATDPLKDVEVPFETGVRRWEDLWDLAAGAKPARMYENLGGKAPPDEPVWGVFPRNNMYGAPGAAIGAIANQLAHVGDYLRTHVAPEKLQQYDLVRAVKETAALDAKMAKEADKAAAHSTQQLTPYKVYEDGMRWVELKLPEKLTEEQGKGVRKAKATETTDVMNGQMEGAPPGGYVAIDTAGKPIKNLYRESIATGKTPEEAFLAGRLAEEGNQMGHCVGGYCEGVASGESKIYSLRDAKGKSHVTVEVAPEGSFTGGTPSPVARQDPSILQIKGKQNRAPDPKYLPYVQDFVKSGKWGEVGDLEGTGLIDLQQYSSRGPSQRSFLGEKGLTNERFLTKEEHSKLLDEYDSRYTALGHPRQRGQIDPKLLKTLGLVGLGGVLGAEFLGDDELRGALMGAAAGFALPRMGSVARRLADATDPALGLMSTRMRNISEPVAHRARDYERKVLKETAKNFVAAEPFLREFSRLDTPTANALGRAMFNGNTAEIQRILGATKNPELVKGFAQVSKSLGDMGKALSEQGRINLVDDYFPRVVKDREGLMGALGGEMKTRLEERLAEATRKAVKSGQEGLTEIEQSIVINRFLREEARRSGQPGSFKRRQIEEVTEKLQPFYDSPVDSLSKYIHNTVVDLEKTRFFGQNLVTSKREGLTYTNTDASIGKVLQAEIEKGKLTHEQAEQLAPLLRKQLAPHPAASSGVQAARNLMYTGLLANLASAGVQVGDVVIATAANGLLPTLSAVTKKLTGRLDVDVAHFGIANTIAEEFAHAAKGRGDISTVTAKFMDQSLKISGFKAVDRFGKDVLLQGALEKYQGWAQDAAGVRKIAAKYGEAFGDEFPQLVDDLKAKRLSDRVDSLLFNELSDFQPVTKLESPELKLDLRGGAVKEALSLGYMMKSFMLKQADIIRREAYNEIKKGNYAKGFSGFTRFSLAMGISGVTGQVIRDWILGRDADIGIADVAVQFFKTFGWSEYNTDKVRQGKLIEAARDLTVPPYKMFDEIMRLDPKAIQYIPIIGKILYNREMEGNEKAAKALEKRDRAAERRERKG